MPELKESEASYQALDSQLKPLLSSHDFHVRGIWADATVEEMEAQWPLDHPVHQGLVYKVELNDPHEVLRGNGGARTNIYPVFSNLSLDKLELKGVHNSSRALLLDFGSAWLQVCLTLKFFIMTHLKTITATIPNTHIHPVVLQENLAEFSLQDS
jgi:hypothetical protein